jgi:hypothetical protein
MLGASLGGTMRGAHHGVDPSRFSLITPPKFGAGGGSCLPSMVVVAHGEPIGQLGCCAATGMTPIASKALASATSLRRRFMADIGVNRMYVSFLLYRKGYKTSVKRPNTLWGARARLLATLLFQISATYRAR